MIEKKTSTGFPSALRHQLAPNVEPSAIAMKVSDSPKRPKIDQFSRQSGCMREAQSAPSMTKVRKTPKSALKVAAYVTHRAGLN